MRGRYRWMIGLLFVLAMPSAWAGGGRIDFSGAIVTPTCAAQAESAALAAGSLLLDRTFTCGGRSQANDSAAPLAYRLSVIRLDGATMTGNRLLQYFVGYRAAAQDAQVQMVTRVYE
jgi:hypothetical protein